MHENNQRVVQNKNNLYYIYILMDQQTNDRGLVWNRFRILLNPLQTKTYLLKLLESSSMDGNKFAEFARRMVKRKKKREVEKQSKKRRRNSLSPQDLYFEI